MSRHGDGKTLLDRPKIGFLRHAHVPLVTMPGYKYATIASQEQAGVVRELSVHRRNVPWRWPRHPSFLGGLPPSSSVVV